MEDMFKHRRNLHLTFSFVFRHCNNFEICNLLHFLPVSGVTMGKICRLILWVFFVSGVLCAGSDDMSVKKGDSVTLPNDFKITNQDTIRWYFNITRIAEMDLSNGKTCTDVQCNEGAERFRGRLKLDHQTGSLTIMNIRTTDIGYYKINVTGGDREKIFSVKVYDIVSVKEGDSVTLPNDFNITKQDRIRWYFKTTQIAGIDLSNGKTCTDVQCYGGTEGFRDRLKLDHQTGNLTIMKFRSTDSGNYTLDIIRTGHDRETTFIVTLCLTGNHENPEGQSETSDSGLTDNHEISKEQSDASDSGSGLSAGAVAGICVAVLLVIGAAGVIYQRRRIWEWFGCITPVSASMQMETNQADSQVT